MASIRLQGQREMTDGNGNLVQGMGANAEQEILFGAGQRVRAKVFPSEGGLTLLQEQQGRLPGIGWQAQGDFLKAAAPWV